MVVMACVAAAAHSSVFSNAMDLDRVIELGYLVMVTPGAGLLSEGRQWYLDSNRRRRSGAALESSPSQNGRSSDAALEMNDAGGVGDAVSAHGSTRPLTKRDTYDDVSRRSASLTTTLNGASTCEIIFDATPQECSTPAATLSSILIVSNEPYGRNGGSPLKESTVNLWPVDYRFLRHHEVSGDSMGQIISILKQWANGWCELTDGSFEIIVHKDYRDQLTNELLLTFQGSAVDPTYNPLAGSAEKPVHIARHEYLCRLSAAEEKKGRSGLLTAIYEYWLREWSEEQDKH